jgi:hypothetical protein
MSEREVYLGDGLFASWDGWQVRLRAPGGLFIQNADLNLWAGTAPSVIAPVGSGCWIVGPIALAAVAIVWGHGVLAR